VIGRLALFRGDLGQIAQNACALQSRETDDFTESKVGGA
jgi:hypothetical protein